MIEEPPGRLTAKGFHEMPGVEDWRVLYWGAYAHYRTTSLAHAVRIVEAVSEAATHLNHFPDIDVRPEGITVRTFSATDGSLSAVDGELARSVQSVARGLKGEPDPSRLLATGIAVAQDEGIDVRPFWAAIMGYELLDDADAIDPQRRNPHVWVHPLDPPKPRRGRTHIDLSFPADYAAQRVEAALAAGGRLVGAGSSGWTIASPDNHGIDIAIWPDTEDGDSDWDMQPQEAEPSADTMTKTDDHLL